MRMTRSSQLFAGFPGELKKPLGPADLVEEEARHECPTGHLYRLIYAGFSALGIAAGASIVRKAGYSPWWVVTGFLPLVNVVMVITFAFADWPVLQENRRDQRLRAVENKGHPSFGYPPAPVLPAAVPLTLGAPDSATNRPYGT